MFGLFAANFLRFLLIALEVLILARVLLSWVEPSGRSTLGGYVFQLTEPILAPIRKLLPRTGMLDLSPMIALIVLSFVMRWVV